VLPPPSLRRPATVGASFNLQALPNIDAAEGLSLFPKTVAMAALGDDLLSTVNKLQDLVFNTIGNDSLDLPQIVCLTPTAAHSQPTRSPTHAY
jgi:hypothetical protein